MQHDLSLVLLAALICALGSWVTARLYRYARNRPQNRAVRWHMLTALTAGVTIWCTHFVAMLGFRPNVPVNFDLALTFTSLVIAVLGSAAGMIVAATTQLRHATAIGGAILGLAISAMHYTGMLAYDVRGLVEWHQGYLTASILLSIVFSAIALTLGSKDQRWSELEMSTALTLGIVVLHFTGMAAFRVTPLDVAGNYMNPEAFRVLALAVAGTAILIVLGGLFSYVVENRAREESIAELTKARNAAESASRAKSEFISVLSHELRTPLTIVLGYAGLLSKLQEMHDKQAAQHPGGTAPPVRSIGEQAELYGQKITVSANHLLSLINDILDYTSMELDDTKLSKMPFPVRGLLVEVAERFQEPAAQRGTRILVECDEITAFADRERCMQILLNLVGNALKFSGSDEVFLRARMEKNGFRFEVEDKGCGIPQESREHIFQAFRQLQHADLRSEGGTGLGLAICKKLATAHGGDISVSSVEGEGTTFTVTMPAAALGRSPSKLRGLRIGGRLGMAG
jgi:signal transduction histidine kinase